MLISSATAPESLSEGLRWYPTSVTESRELTANPSIDLYLRPIFSPRTSRKLSKKKFRLLSKDSHSLSSSVNLNSRREKSSRSDQLKAADKPKIIATLSDSSGAKSSQLSEVQQAVDSSTPKHLTLHLSPQPASCGPRSLIAEDGLDLFIEKFNANGLPDQNMKWRSILEQRIRKLERTNDRRQIREGLFDLLRLNKTDTKWLVLNVLRKYLIPSTNEKGNVYREEIDEFKRLTTTTDDFIQQTILANASPVLLANLIGIYRDLLEQIYLLSLWFNQPIDAGFVHKIESRFMDWKTLFSRVENEFLEDSFDVLEEVVEKFITPATESEDRQSFWLFAAKLSEHYEDFSSAVHFYHYSLKNESFDERKKLSIIRKQGDLSRDINQGSNAIDYYKKALEISLRNEIHEESILINLDLFSINSSMGEREIALSFLSEALKIAKQSGLKKHEADISARLGEFYLEDKKYEVAIRHLKNGLTIAEGINDPETILSNAMGLGNYYSQFDLFIQAIGHYKSALEAVERLENNVEQRVDIYARLAHTSHQRGDIEGRNHFLALVSKFLVDDTQLTNEQRDQFFFRLALIYTDFSPDEAIEILNNILGKNVQDQQFEVLIYNALGVAYSTQMEFTRAMQAAGSALEISLKIDDVHQQARALDCLGAVHEHCGDSAAAEDCYRWSIQCYSRLESNLENLTIPRICLSKEYSSVYVKLEKLLFNSGRMEDALCVADSGRARTLSYLLNRKLFVDPSITKTMTIQEMQSIAARFNTTIVFFSFPSMNASIHLSDNVLQSTIDSAESSVAHVWVVSSDSINACAIDLETVLGPILKKKWWNICSSDSEFYKKWYEVLVKPIELLLPAEEGSRLTFIVKGEISRLPFAALQDAQGKYLIERYTLSFAPSVHVLSLMNELDQKFSEARYRSGRKSLIVGDPEQGGVQSQLPPARTESDTIRRLTEGLSLIGQSAVKGNVMEGMPNANLLHFTCHGLGSGKKKKNHSIYEGCLSLSEGIYPDDLYAEEIRKMSLNSELAFLSACETGQGHLTQEGTVGLVHAFLTTGIPTVIATSFSTSAGPSESIAVSFYRHYLGRSLSGLKAVQEDPPMDKDHALRAAMLEEMKRNPDPSCWAFFFLVGLPTGAFKSPLRIDSKL